MIGTPTINYYDPSRNLEWNQIDFDLVKRDYKTFLEKGYNVDYQHEFDLTVDDMTLPENTGYFWQVIPLMLKGKPLDLMPEEVQNCDTVKMLQNQSVLPLVAVFSILEPNSQIDPHRDADDELVYNSRHLPLSKRKDHVVKYHLGIDVPEMCGLSVGGERRTLRNHTLNVFNETQEHYAWNQSNQRRGVLIVSYLHNDIFPVDQHLTVQRRRYKWGIKE